MKHKDFSLHFTTDGQSVEELQKKYNDWDAETLEKGEVLGDESDMDDLILHHCFMPEKLCIENGIPLDALNFIEDCCDQQICWYHITDNVEISRWVMLKNLQRLGGVAIFLGKITGGVEREYKFAQGLGLPCVLIE